MKGFHRRSKNEPFLTRKNETSGLNFNFGVGEIEIKATERFADGTETGVEWQLTGLPNVFT